MSGFAFHAEPATVVGDQDSESRQLYVGAGYDGDDEKVCVGIFEEYRHKAAICLNRDELAAVIDSLMETLGELDCRIGGVA
ncbi:MAG: hypothetical protein PGN37_20355 [Mycobacterium kyogaense]|uniref:hypothetical protein n=1 Tax=Mycobacterium kyogaense TaxID=2212479 RepID=UPI002FF6C16A